MTTEQGETKIEVSNDAKSIELTAAIVAQLLKRPRKLVTEITFSREEIDWLLYKTSYVRREQ